MRSCEWPSCEDCAGSFEKQCYPCNLLLIKALSLVAKRSSLIEYSRVVNIILLNMKSLFYQRELIREFILDFLSSAWDVCRSFTQHRTEPRHVQLQLLTTNYLFLGHIVFKFRRPSCEAASGHRVKIVLVAQKNCAIRVICC